MDLRFEADFQVDGLVRRLGIFGERMQDIQEPLARCTGVLRGAAKRRIAEGGPGWAPLDPETLRRKLTTEKHAFLSSAFPSHRPGTAPILRAQVALERAGERLAEARTTRATLAAVKRAAREGETLGHYLESFKAAFPKLRDADVGTMVAFVQRELRRQRVHGIALRAARALPLEEGESIRVYKYKVKSRGKLVERTGSVVVAPSKQRQALARIGRKRYKTDSRSIGVLGGLYDSLRIVVEGATSRIFSKPAWSGVHNRGGTAGHGAKIPKREFLKFDEQSLRTFVRIFTEHMFEAFLS